MSDHGVPQVLPGGDWRQQMRALAIAPIDARGHGRAECRSRDLVNRHLRAMAVLILTIAAGMGAYLAGVDAGIDVSDGGPRIPYVLIPTVAFVVIAGGLLASSNGREAVETSDDWLAPLGLQMTEIPRSIIVHDLGTDRARHDLVGRSVVGGRRHGRVVEIVMEAKAYETFVEGSYPEFRVTRTGSDWRGSDGTPAVVSAVTNTLGGERWARVEVAGGPDGIRVRRKVRASQVRDGLWLSDLWLAERLADELGRR